MIRHQEFLEPVDFGSFFYEFHGIAYLDFLEQMPAVGFYGMYTDMAAVGDHLGGQSFADQVQYFFFALR